jgi:hypothetical protein
MAVMAREAWTDHRLDDLNKKVDDGFGEMREEFRAVRSEMGRAFQAMRTELRTESQATRNEMKKELQGVRTEMKEELRAIHGEIGALNRTVIQLAFAMVGTVFLGFMGTIAALVTLV